MPGKVLRTTVFIGSCSLGWLGCSSDDTSEGGGAQNTAGTSAAAGASGSFAAGGALTGSGGSATGGAMLGAGGATIASGGSSVGGASGAAGSAMAGAAGSAMAGAAGTPVGVGGEAGAPSGGPDAGMAGSAGAGDAGGPPGTACLDGTGDYEMDGPYDVSRETVTIGSKGQFTIYYPDPLEEACPHPIVAWGNGTTITGGTAYDHFLNHAGSWGIVSIASHNSNVGDGTFHRAAIDYLLEQNEDSSSRFFGKLSPRAGVSGHSQGGAGGDRASSHPNVEANVNVQGSFGNPPPGDAAFLCLTGTEDIADTGCPAAVRAASVPALSASWDGADHVATTLFEGEGSDQYLRLFTAWFRCFLADDQAACAMFKGGADCPVCQESGWDDIFANNY